MSMDTLAEMIQSEEGEGLIEYEIVYESERVRVINVVVKQDVEVEE